MSSGIFKNPKKPKTEPAVIKFGESAIKVIFIDLKSISIINPIMEKTIPNDFICEENNDCSILLYKTARPVT